VPDIVRFGDRPRLVLVHQDDLAAHAPHHQGVRRRCSHQPASDDSNFHGFPPPGLTTSVGRQPPPRGTHPGRRVVPPHDRP
jgi:hypothetical protein